MQSSTTPTRLGLTCAVSCSPPRGGRKSTRRRTSKSRSFLRSQRVLRKQRLPRNRRVPLRQRFLRRKKEAEWSRVRLHPSPHPRLRRLQTQTSQDRTLFTQLRLTPNRREPSGRDRKVALDVVTKPNQRSAVPRQGAENSDVNKVQKGVNTSRHSPNHTVRYLAYPSFSSLKCSS